MAQDNKRFLGRGWSFPPTFDDISGSVEMVEGEDDIRESLLILMSTFPGERVMFPEYGFGPYAHVFDGTDSSMLTYLKGEIEDAVRKYEPRIRIDELTIDTTDSVDGRLMVSLSYIIRTTNSRSNMVFPFYFAEGTNVRAE